MRSERHTASRRTPVDRCLALLAGLALAWLPILGEEPVGRLDLGAALEAALAHNPELEAAAAEARAGDARVHQAGARDNPELDLRYYRLGIPRGNVEPDAGRSRITLSQPIDIGKRRKRIRLARTERDLVQLDHVAKRVEVETTVAARFAELLGAQQRIQLLGDQLELFETKRDWVAGLVKTGTMRKLEMHQITRRLGLVRIEHRQAQSALKAARHRLATSWGSATPQFSEAVGRLDRLPNIPDLDSLMLLAEDGPALTRSEVEVARSEAALRLAKTRRIPEFQLGAGTRWQEGTNDRDYLADLEITLPIVNTGKGAIMEAQHGIARARAERKAAEARIGAQIAELHDRLATQRTDSETLAVEVVPAARATADALELGFDNGAVGMDDLLDAKRDLSRAEVDLLEALVAYHGSLAELGALVGRNLAR